MIFGDSPWVQISKISLYLSQNRGPGQPQKREPTGAANARRNQNHEYFIILPAKQTLQGSLFKIAKANSHCFHWMPAIIIIIFAGLSRSKLDKLCLCFYVRNVFLYFHVVFT